MKQLVFLFALLVTLTVFFLTIRRLYTYLRLTRKAYPLHDWGRRINMTLAVAFGQNKIFRFPFVGLLHALVFWGFLVILVGSIEMVIDGLAGTERVLGIAGPVYDILVGTGDIFAYVIGISILVFLGRRLLIHVKRFYGIEMLKKSKQDANIALLLILLLMVSLAGMNIAYLRLNPLGHDGSFPVSRHLTGLLPAGAHSWHEVFWWSHILLIFLFANILPYSKHFHVFMSVPNVLLSRLGSLTYMSPMPKVTEEVKLMMNPETAFAAAPADTDPPERFGVKDVEDSTWKHYIDSLTCTECGRCTSVCPANITGKRLSPRKIMIDMRARMKEKGPGLVRDKAFDDGKSLLRSYITEEELWACTTCNACAQECPVNIDQPSLILAMRRYLAMEEGAAPNEINMMFRNIENNGAPWQYSPEDRLNWAEGLTMKQAGS